MVRYRGLERDGEMALLPTTTGTGENKHDLSIRIRIAIQLVQRKFVSHIEPATLHDEIVHVDDSIERIKSICLPAKR